MRSKQMISFTLCLLLCLFTGCAAQKSKSAVSSVSTVSKKTQASKETTPVIVTDPAQVLEIHLEDAGDIERFMRYWATESAYSSSGHEVTLDKVRTFISVSQLRPISIKDSSFSDLMFYSAHDSTSGGRLYVFYGPSREKKGALAAQYCLYVGKQLHTKDFDSLKTGSSTLGDVKKIDPATVFNFYDPDAKSPHWYVSPLEEAGLGVECYSVHVTREGITDIGYRKTGGKYIIEQVVPTSNKVVDTINEKDWLS